ncbi:hypothetical protein AAG570_010064 [Ranatra chinensis]|uniref:Uncharacterized protein n=1 Tax=Ranatra chinensis TaxID=642074 RepID=A0ABD0YLF0_9HEMI
MSPFTVLATSALLFALVHLGASVNVNAKANVDVDADTSRADMLKEKVKEFLDKAQSELQKKCILEVAAKPVVKAKVLGLGLDLTKTLDLVKDKVADAVEDLTPDQKSSVKGKAVGWLKNKEQDLQECLSL